MNLDVDELKLTAYALGELDADDIAAVEAHLATDAAARRQVEEIRATASLLTSELANEPDIGLTALQHAAIERRLSGGETRPLRMPERPIARRNWALWGSLAASIVIVCTVMASVLPKIYQIGNGHGQSGHRTESSNQAPPDTGAPAAGRAPIIVLPDNEVPPITTPRHNLADELASAGWPQSLAGGAVALPQPGGSTGADGAPAGELPFVAVADHPLSAVPASPLYGSAPGADAFAAIQRQVEQNRRPSPELVRTDELLNAFAYHDAAPGDGAALAASAEVAACPWNANHRLVRVAVKAADGAGAAPASDVRVQIEFNPATAGAYRLIGYEHRPIADALQTMFAEPSQDAHRAEAVIAGRTLTALYEVVPAGQPLPPVAPQAGAEPLKYQQVVVRTTGSADLLTVKVRYRASANGTGADRTIEHALADPGTSIDAASEDFRFAAAVATLGMVLRQSDANDSATLDLVEKLAAPRDPAEVDPARSHFLELVRKLKTLPRQ